MKTHNQFLSKCITFGTWYQRVNWRTMKHKTITVKSLNFIFVITFVMLAGCIPPAESNETDKFDSELKSFNKSISNVGKTLDLVDAMQTEVNKVERKRALGEITDEEADKLLIEIKETYGRTIARKSNFNPATSLPAWAQQLRLTEPMGMKLDPDYSQMTRVENPDEGFNSILLVYLGDYNLAMKEAARIAKMANIPLGKDYLQAVELSKTYNTSPIKGVAYMNFDPFIEDKDFNISITVDETGMLTISAVDAMQMKNNLKTRKLNN